MSRHRGAKPPRRCGLLGEISLLSPAYLLSVEQRPFHTGPLDHYDQLSFLLDLYVSQSSYLMPLHSTRDCQTRWGNLCAPPLLFRRRPPQSNYPSHTVPRPDHGTGLESKHYQAGISSLAPRTLACPFHSLPAILHKQYLDTMWNCSKGARGLSV